MHESDFEMQCFTTVFLQANLSTMTTGGHYVCACVTVGFRVRIWRLSVLCLHFYPNLRLNFTPGIWAISIVFRSKGSLTSVLI